MAQCGQLRRAVGGEAAKIGDLAEKHGLKALMRPGLALYGLAPEYEPPFAEKDSPQTLENALVRLRPVLTWKTQVVSVRCVPAGAVVGYNGTFVATEPMRLALLAVGYADGLDRKLGNRFSLLVRGQRAPLVGRISMDQAVLDVTEIPDVTAGDEAVILESRMERRFRRSITRGSPGPLRGKSLRGLGRVSSGSRGAIEGDSRVHEKPVAESMTRASFRVTGQSATAGIAGELHCRHEEGVHVLGLCSLLCRLHCLSDQAIENH